MFLVMAERKGEQIMSQLYEAAKAEYAKFGVDTDAAIAKLKELPVS